MWLAKRLSLNLNFSFINRISLLLIQIATQLSSRGWVDPVLDPILPEKFLGYSRESNPGSVGWQSDVLTTIPNRRSRRNNYETEFFFVNSTIFDTFNTLGFLIVTNDCKLFPPSSPLSAPGKIEILQRKDVLTFKSYAAIDLTQLTMNFDRRYALFIQKLYHGQHFELPGAGIRSAIFNRCNDATVSTREVPLTHKLYFPLY